MFTYIVNARGPLYPSFYVFGTKNLPFWNKVSVEKPSCASAEIVPTTLPNVLQLSSFSVLVLLADRIGAPILARDITVS